MGAEKNCLKPHYKQGDTQVLFGLRLSLFGNIVLICQTQPKDASRRYHSSKESYIFLSNHFLLLKHILTARVPTPFSPLDGCHGLNNFTNWILQVTLGAIILKKYCL